MSRWTPELLDRLRRRGDPLADRTLEQAAWVRGEVARISAAFRSFAADEAEIPADAPPELLAFAADTQTLPDGLDTQRVERGAEVMLNNAVPVALVLLLKSLPSGYAAPRLSAVLHLTGNLEKRPYRRALGVLQMLVNLSQPGAFLPGGRALVTGQKLRLLHAGIRRVVRRKLPDFVCRHGTPVSQLDMIFTIMTFSVHVIEGLKALRVKLPPDEEQDLFYLWRMYGLLQGIRPDWMPESIEDGHDFCRAYEAELGTPADNPEGVALTAADLAMMRRLLPWPLRLLGLGVAPRVYLIRLLGAEGAARVGVAPLRGHALLEWLILELPLLWHGLLRVFVPDRKAHAHLSLWFFRSLIEQAWGGEVRFSVPEHLKDLRKLA